MIFFRNINPISFRKSLFVFLIFLCGFVKGTNLEYEKEYLFHRLYISDGEKDYRPILDYSKHNLFSFVINKNEIFDSLIVVNTSTFSIWINHQLFFTNKNKISLDQKFFIENINEKDLLIEISTNENFRDLDIYFVKKSLINFNFKNYIFHKTDNNQRSFILIFFLFSLSFLYFIKMQNKEYARYFQLYIRDTRLESGSSSNISYFTLVYFTIFLSFLLGFLILYFTKYNNKFYNSIFWYDVITWLKYSLFVFLLFIAKFIYTFFINTVNHLRNIYDTQYYDMLKFIAILSVFIFSLVLIKVLIPSFDFFTSLSFWANIIVIYYILFILFCYFKYRINLKLNFLQLFVYLCASEFLCLTIITFFIK